MSRRLFVHIDACQLDFVLLASKPLAAAGRPPEVMAVGHGHTSVLFDSMLL